MHYTAILSSDLVAGRLYRLSTVTIVLLLIILPANAVGAISMSLPESWSDGPGDLRITLPPLLTLATIGFWLLARWLDPAPRPFSMGPAALAIPLMALVVLGLVTIPFSINPIVSALSARYHLLLLGLYLVTVNSRTERGAVAAALACGAAVQAAIGWPQFLLGHSVGLQAIGEYAVDSAWPGASVVMMGQSRVLRAYGLSGHPNQLGGYLMFSIPIVVGYLLQPPVKRYFALALATGLFLSLAALLATFSRAAWLGLAAGAAGMLALLRDRRQAGLRLPAHWKSFLGLAVLGIAAFAAINWQPLLGRLGAGGYATETQSFEERGSLNAAAWQLVRERPIHGVGLGNFVEGVSVLLPEQAADLPGMSVHNLFLLSTAELGMLGGPLWLYLMAAPWLVYWRSRGKVALTPWSVGLYGALAGLAVVSMLDYYLWSTLRGGAMLWLTWGLWAREWNRSCKPTEFSPLQR